MTVVIELWGYRNDDIYRVTLHVVILFPHFYETIDRINNKLLINNFPINLLITVLYIIYYINNVAKLSQYKHGYLSSQIYNRWWGGEIHKIKVARTFIIFLKNQSWLFEVMIQRQNNPEKVKNVMHHHRVCYSYHGNVPEYTFSGLHRWTVWTYLLPVAYQYLWLGYSLCF